jgi:hypothetical protein
MKVGKILGYDIVEDNEIQEIRLPKKIIDMIESSFTFIDAKEFG